MGPRQWNGGGKERQSDVRVLRGRGERRKRGEERVCEDTDKSLKHKHEKGMQRQVETDSYRHPKGQS